MSENFKDDVKLDLNNLDTNAMEHAEKYAEWAEKWALAIFERDKAKERLTNYKADLDKQIREDPAKYGWNQSKDPTEKFIDQAINLDEEVRKLSMLMIEAQYQVNLFGSAKESFERRDKALSVLCELFKANYFINKPPRKEYRESQYEKDKEASREANTKGTLITRRVKNDHV